MRGACPAGCRQTLPLWYPQGGLAVLVASLPAVSFISCPLSPRPPSPVGKGELFTLFRRGLRPRHPCIRPFAALIVPAMRAPHARSLRFAAKTTGSGSLWAVPSAKERGDRERWNYPSQATAAFEMVLSPGAGIASAAQGQAPPLSTTAAGRTSAAGGLMQGCRGRSPRRNKLLVSPFPPGRALCERGSGDGGNKASQRQGQQAAKKASHPTGCRFGRVCKCRRRSNAGDARGEAPCMK